MKSKLHYVCKPYADGSYVVKVSAKPQSLDQRLVAVAEMCVVNQLAEDYSDKLANMEIAKSRFHVHSNYIKGRFGDVKRKMNRQTYNEKEKGRFNECVSDIVDSCENNFKWVEMLARDEIAKTTEKSSVDALLYVAFIQGFVGILKNVQNALYGGHNVEYDQICEELDIVKNELRGCSKSVFDGGLRDVENAIDLAFKQIKEKCVAFVAQAKKERELCSKETTTA